MAQVLWTMAFLSKALLVMTYCDPKYADLHREKHTFDYLAEYLKAKGLQPLDSVRIVNIA